MEGKAFRNELICSIPYRVTLQKKEKSEANAALIAAAPEMYNMLKSIANLSWISGIFDVTENRP